MKRASALLVAVLTVCLLALPAHAASYYPVSVEEYTYGPFDQFRVSKVYQLSAQDDPSLIPTDDFEREGYHYTLIDITREEQADTDTKLHTEIVTLESKSKDMAKILPLLAATSEITTEDGYTGVLTLDTASISVEAAGYGTSSRAVSATRSYPNLSDADTALIPRTIEDSGRTLTLTDVQWQEAGGFFHATATYGGTATSRYATGYTVSASYTGEVSKSSEAIITYTAIFSGTRIEDSSLKVPAETDPPQETPDVDSGSVPSGFDLRWLILLPVLAGIVGLAFGGRFIYKHVKSKKEWKEYNK